MAASSSMQGKTVVITGATNGIGLAAARAIGREGATLVLVARNAARGERVVQELQQSCGNQDIHFYPADLSSMQEVRAVAGKIQQAHPRIHVLLNNAGGFFARRVLSADGLEMTFALNHMNYFLLTHLLLDNLKAASQARIVNVSSFGHRFALLRLNDLQSEKLFVNMDTYCISKLHNVLFTLELARRLEGSGVTVNCMNPGATATGFSQGEKGLFAFIIKLVTPFMHSAEAGADTAVWLCTDPSLEGKTGGYYQNRRLTRPSRAARNRHNATVLWQESLRLSGL